MDIFQGHNHFFAVMDALVMIKLGVNSNIAISTARKYHDVNLLKLTKMVDNIISSTKNFYDTYDLKDIDFSTGTERLPDFYFEAIEKEGDAGSIRVETITNLVKERYNLK